MATDFYDVLGVPRGAGDDEIGRAYRKLARQYHPDVNHDPGAEDRFKEVSEAYEVLSDPAQRKRYDRFGEDFRRVPEDYGERAPRGRTVYTSGPSHGGFEDFDFEDLFGGVFRRAGRGGPVPGADQEAELTLSVEDAYRGGPRRLTIGGRDLDVTIPPGVVDGQRIRLSGQGGQGSGGATSGDLFLVVRIAPHPRYRLEGRDVVVDLPVTPWEAALGATVPITTPGGEAKVRVVAGSSSGRRLRLRGEGMPNPRGKAGDLYAVVKVMVPKKLGRRERELFEELAAVSDFDPRGS
ncbi:DnaJ C-terminal domain-containing protein [Lentzea flaviverrucosa]|uniref:Curved DNA-binding protein n=1 Tax=Lentzea flaviverrucosa TaxID=200379 RepID=A0A1H9BE23_9PSEU|nr:DnaJ C-terminal domain-containing protein [Lentzea flaviverrucosa]RDI31819.1 curved DNA-binding protein [Lentzea flaviverrucosa]SEP86518.1 curved DNA-binding protein [Lentzea flaviverrucosa]